MVRKFIIFIAVLLFPFISTAENFKITKSTSLIKEPSIEPDIVMKPICTLMKGTNVKVLETKSYSTIPHFYYRIKVLDGECQNNEGWITHESLEK